MTWRKLFLVVAAFAIDVGTADDLAGRGARFKSSFLHAAKNSHVDGQSMCSVPQEKGRVFVHSMPKTGTTSIGKALKLLGYRDCSSNRMTTMPSFQLIPPANNIVKKFPVNAVPETVQEEVKDMLSQLKQDVDALQESAYFIGDAEPEDKGTCDSYSDFPIGLTTYMDLRLKMLLWPNSTYIWIDRPFDEWLASLVKDRASESKDIKAVCSIPQMRKFIDDRRQELVELERAVPGSVLFLNTSTLDWEHLLPGLPVPNSCTPPAEVIPHANTAKDTIVRHKRTLSFYQKKVVLHKPCD